MTVTFSGPLFDGNASGLVQQEIAATVKELVDRGTEILATKYLLMRPAGVYLSVSEAKKGKASTGNYLRNLTPTYSGDHGRIWDGGVVYGPWLEFGSTTRRFAGYASFRRAGQNLQDEAQGIAEKHAQRIAQQLGGG